MLIRSIRLKNIKSYGEGPSGEGIRIGFERGLNRIAGKNGSGKSTVIEAIGYTLFDFAPNAGYRIDLDTLMVRNGASCGEIEAEIVLADGCTYRVKRGVGKKSRLRWTVSDENDFVTHDDEAGVRQFLSAAYHLYDGTELPSLFHKLVGIRQGRLLDPFEFTPGDARRHFAPILEVEIYQECFNRLAEPLQLLRNEWAQVQGDFRSALAHAEAHAQAPAEVHLLQERIQTQEPRLDALKRELQQAQQEQARWDEIARAVPAAESALLGARKDVERTDKELHERRELLARSEQAQVVLEHNEQAYKIYLNAEKREHELHARRETIEAQREQAIGLKEELVKLETRATETDEQARKLIKVLEQQALDLAQREALLEQRRSIFVKSNTTSDAESSEREPDISAIASAEHWSSTLQASAVSALRAGEVTAEANTALASFDPEYALKAKAILEAERRELDKVLHRQTELETVRKNRREMIRGLEESRLCPLLAERCRQFDSGKLVLSEVKLDEWSEQAAAVVEQHRQRFWQAEQQYLRAEEYIKSTEALRARADAALTEIEHHLKLAYDPTGRAAFELLADAYRQLQPQGVELPALYELADPGEEPWKALASGQVVAQRFSEFAKVVSTHIARWKIHFEKQRNERIERQRKLDLEGQWLEREAEELAQRRQALSAQKSEHLKLLQTFKDLCSQRDDVRKKLSVFADSQKELQALLFQIRQAQETRTQHLERYKTYLAAQTDAQRAEKARADVALAVSALQQARKTAEDAFEALNVARTAFDPDKYARIKLQLQQAVAQVSALERDIERDRQQLTHWLERLRALQQAQAQLKRHREQMELLDARAKLLDKARHVLRNAGPRVAEHLIEAVNARAQKIYTALSPHEPGQLQWQSDFELRLANASGIRRFSMLSGGQRVKAALAIHLALVQQFSRAGICIFDEPTYALDRESRALLAETIVAAQEVSRFEQLIVVSHDDAFDGHVEHTVNLEYSAVTGTCLASPR